MRLRLPEAMVGRILLVLICAVGLELLGNLALERWQQRELLSDQEIGQVAMKLTEAEVVAFANHRRHRSERLQLMSQANLSLNWVPRTVITDFGGSFE